jgi:hypothetical protein
MCVVFILEDKDFGVGGDFGCEIGDGWVRNGRCFGHDRFSCEYVFVKYRYNALLDVSGLAEL